MNIGTHFDSAFLNVAATFRQCLSPIVSKLSTRDKNLQGLLVTDLFVLGALHWWAGVGNDRISGCRKAINIGQQKKNL